MATEVTLPELGESVTEGVIIEILVEVGDEIEADDPVVEISTDKIDTEVPSPSAGTVTEIRVAVDDEVQVGQVLVVLDGNGGGSSADEGADADDGEDADDTTETDDGGADDGGAQDGGTQDGGAQDGGSVEASDSGGSSVSDTSGQRGTSSGSSASAGSDPGDTTASGDAALLSPLVRKMLREAGLSASDVEGSGQGGRITREDAEKAIEQGGPSREATRASAPPSGGDEQAPPPSGAGGGASVVGMQTPQPRAGGDRPEASPTQVDFSGQREVTEDLSRVRKAIAKSMLNSLQTTAQLTAIVEADVTALMNTRAALKDDFKARHGASLSPLPIISRAALMVLPRHPSINASMDQDAGTATFHNYVNLGMAIDTEKGLLVPNIKDAQDLTIGGLAKRIADIARRTRGKGLQPDEISGGTFTITNTGSRGTLMDTPILNPPESAILATCAIEKRPVVVNDGLGESIAIRWMTYLCMSYDHRMIDGADAARFLQDLKWVLENHDFAPEIAG